MSDFVRSVLITAPIAEVFRFHEREDALTLLSPPFPPVKLLSKSASGLAVGTRLELRIGIFDWTALHTAYERDRLFEDRQIRGPFKKWIHRHEFERVGDSTRLTDRVQYELPGGSLANLLFGWNVKLGLINMFTYRHRMTKRFCEKR